MTTTPRSLLERLHEPFDPEAWSRFAALYTPLLYAWARRVGLQEQDAADLVQDVFVLLLRVLPSFRHDPDRSFRGWLRTVTLNHWRNNRRRWQERLARDATIAPEELAAAADLEALWEEEYRKCLASRALTIMRSDFQEKTWKACWEMVVNERSADEIAVELGISVGAVYAAKFRVLQRLRQEFKGMVDDE